MRITRVELGNWRNFRQVDVELAGRLFLVGPNASGKSNFLHALRFLGRIASVGGGFQKALDDLDGIGGVRSLYARQNSDVALEVAVGTENQPRLWEYELHFNGTKSRPPRLSLERVSRSGEVLFTRPDDSDHSDPELLGSTRLEQIHANKEFRLLAEFLRSIRYLHVVPQLVREPDRSVGRSADPFGGDFLEQLHRAPKKQRESRLRKINQALKIAVPQLVELKLEPDKAGMPHLLGKYEHWRPQGAWQSERQLSDGTLRLLGLLWALLDDGGPLLLEEPELSLHPAVVEHLAAIFARLERQRGRQVLVSTHSIDLLRDEGIGLDEVLLLQPGEEGTEVRLATGIDQVRTLLEAGIALPEAVLPHTRPRHSEQLALFDP